MYYLYFLLNRINYKQFFYFIIPLSSVLLGAIYSLTEGNTFASKEFFVVTLQHLITPYFVGAVGILLFSIQNGINKKQKQTNSFNATNTSLVDILDTEVFNFENYAKGTFFSWIVYVIPLIYYILI
ncbi:hypothetical protein GXP67_02760 [Rhodocytophaga rosea]|uniref:Uncharacterized protein n=1 Tax=Rhodocytophaga rosea TaxID=2704465 RepID=A0A6C0GCG5_9BACT|nr:hypothetical protein [Rhodocytophaga rosea]QHT65661.1 hypothetical protein GXP67_02760 [Rhodocytophaga rosea]